MMLRSSLLTADAFDISEEMEPKEKRGRSCEVYLVYCMRSTFMCGSYRNGRDDEMVKESRGFSNGVVTGELSSSIDRCLSHRRRHEKQDQSVTTAIGSVKMLYL